MLATSRSGERSRRWLQERLWGSRERTNSQASLRRELSNLRPLVNIGDPPLLIVNHEAVALDLKQVVVDIRDPDQVVQLRGEFLEGIDIAWEESFEDWLREERQAIAAAREAAETGALPVGPRDDQTSSSGRPTIGIVVHQQELPAQQMERIDDIAGKLAERITRLRWLPLIGASAGPVQIQAGDTLVRAGRRLGVEYLLHCRSSFGRSIVIALSEARSGRMLWSNREELGDTVSPVEIDRILTDVVAAVSMQVATDQEERVRDRSIHDLNADELLWRARWHMRRLTVADLQIADNLLDMAAQARPGSAEILIEKAYAEAWKLWADGEPLTSIETLRSQVMLARDTDPYDARAWLLLGILDTWLGRHDSAAALMQEAITLNPSLSSAYAHLGSCYSLSGCPEDGLAMVRTALRLNPLDTQNFHQFGELALATLMLGHHDRSVIEADNALARRPGYVYGHVFKISALWMMGEHARAREASAALLQVRPNFDPATLEWLPFKDRSWNRRLRDTLTDALQFQRA